MVNDLTISLVFTTLGNKPKKFDFVHQTVSHREVCVGWAQDCFIHCSLHAQWYLLEPMKVSCPEPPPSSRKEREGVWCHKSRNFGLIPRPYAVEG